MNIGLTALAIGLGVLLAALCCPLWEWLANKVFDWWDKILK